MFPMEIGPDQQLLVKPAGPIRRGKIDRHEMVSEIKKHVRA
jgi:hypothetical protein